MRQRQSSVMSATQYPVMSIGAIVRGVRGGAGAAAGGGAGGAGCCCAVRPSSAASAIANAYAILVFIQSLLPDDRFALGVREVLEHRLDEAGGGHEAGVRSVVEIVVERRPRRLDLVDRQAALDHVLDAIAHDGHHVAVLEHVGLVANPSVPGDDES